MSARYDAAESVEDMLVALASENEVSLYLGNPPRYQSIRVNEFSPTGFSFGFHEGHNFNHPKAEDLISLFQESIRNRPIYKSNIVAENEMYFRRKRLAIERVESLRGKVG